MKPYVVKYLPVEGEIQEGDKAKETYPINPRIVEVEKFNKDGMIKAKGDNKWYSPEALYKVKMFLCSRNIRVGDTCKMFVRNTWMDYMITSTTDPSFIEDSIKDNTLLKPVAKILDAVSWLEDNNEYDFKSVPFLWTCIPD